MFLISNDVSTQAVASDKLAIARQAVDEHFVLRSYWRDIRIQSRQFTTKRSLKFYIEAYRTFITKKQTSVDETISFFTNIVMAILDSLSMDIQIASKSNLWMQAG